MLTLLLFILILFSPIAFLIWLAHYPHRPKPKVPQDIVLDVRITIEEHKEEDESSKSEINPKY